MARYVVTYRATTVDDATGVRSNITEVYEHVEGLGVQPGPVIMLQNHAQKIIAIIPVDQIQSCICKEADSEASPIVQAPSPTLAFEKSKLVKGIH